MSLCESVGLSRGLSLCVSLFLYVSISLCVSLSVWVGAVFHFAWRIRRDETGLVSRAFVYQVKASEYQSILGAAGEF